MIYKDLEFEVIYSRRKTIAIEVDKNSSVRVKAPKITPKHIILNFVESKYAWILKAKEKQLKKHQFYNLDDQKLAELKDRAKEYIPQRVKYFSELMGLYPSMVKINFAKTRFGSCSAKNSLNFSAFLMLFPYDAVDYVIVHELAHIKHRNHQKAFYSLIEKYMPDYKKRASLLKIK